MMRRIIRLAPALAAAGFEIGRREAIPMFEPSAFAASLPYEREEDRQTVLDALLGAGAGD